MRSSSARIGWLVLALFGVMAVSFAGYHLSPGLGALHRPLAALFGATLFLSVLVGPGIAYTVAATRGLGLGPCLLAAAVNPLCWVIKEILRLTESHPVVECLYWALNPLSFWLVCFVGFELGLGTLVARGIRRRRGEEVRGPGWPAAVVAVVSLAAVVGAYAWGRGENLYVIFLEGYRALFGSGLS